MKFSSSFRSSQNYKDSLMTFGTLSFGLRTRQLLATHAEVGYCKQNCRFRFFRLLIGSETIISPTLQIAPTGLLSIPNRALVVYTHNFSHRGRLYAMALAILLEDNNLGYSSVIHCFMDFSMGTASC